MIIHPFPQEKLNSVLKSIDQALKQVKNPIAAFDADGTLWSHDAGEQFFNYEVEKKLVPNLPPDPWAHYNYMKAHVSKEAAYLWLAQINAGQPLEQVLKWSRECTTTLGPVPVFEAQQKIISHLKNSGVTVYIVTASIQWAVIPAAELYGIDADHVIGIRTKIKNGIVTDQQDGIITYREGKVHGLLERTNGQHPFYAAGNSEGDLPLLEAATHLRMVLASATAAEHAELHEIEQHMIGLAQSRGWFFHSYV